MTQELLELVDREVIETAAFGQLSARGHDFSHGDGDLGGGPALGMSIYATSRRVSCTRCGKKFQFERVPGGGWELDKYSTNLSRFSCADFRAQNTAIRNRWAQVMASWSKN